jgi:hypothetical protein
VLSGQRFVSALADQLVADPVQHEGRLPLFAL